MKLPDGMAGRRVLVAAGFAFLIAAAGVTLWRANAPVPQSQQEQAAAIADTLRCPTCQGLSVADSPSTIAAGMREIIAEQLAEGRGPNEVREFFVDRYGPWILLSPPADGLGFLVWTLPLGAVAVGAIAAIHVARRRKRSPLPAPTAEQREAAVQAYERFAADPQTWEGNDELEAALGLLHAVRTDTPDAGPPEAAAEERAVRNVVAAMSRTGRLSSARGRPVGALPPRRGRSVAWSAVGGGFAIVLAAALSANLAPRLAGQFSSGNEVVASPTPDLEALEREAAANADDPAAWRRLGDAAVLSGQYPRAAEAYRRALKLDPERPDVRVALASTLLQTGAAGDAVAQLEDVLRADPDDADALLLVGFVARQAGEDQAAEIAWRRLLRVAPDHPAAPMARRLLDGDDE